MLYPYLRLAKLLAVMLLFSGCLGALLPRDLRDRRLLAYAVAGPGFGLTWLFGFLLVWHLSTPLTAPWVLAGIPLSIVSIQGVLYTVGKEGRRTWGSAAVIFVPLLATIALMVLRPW